MEVYLNGQDAPHRRGLQMLPHDGTHHLWGAMLRNLRLCTPPPNFMPQRFSTPHRTRRAKRARSQITYTVRLAYTDAAPCQLCDSALNSAMWSGNTQSFGRGRGSHSRGWEVPRQQSAGGAQRPPPTRHVWCWCHGSWASKPPCKGIELGLQTPGPPLKACAGCAALHSTPRTRESPF